MDTLLAPSTSRLLDNIATPIAPTDRVFSPSRHSRRYPISNLLSSSLSPAVAGVSMEILGWRCHPCRNAYDFAVSRPIIPCSRFPFSPRNTHPYTTHSPYSWLPTISRNIKARLRLERSSLLHPCS